MNEDQARQIVVAMITELQKEVGDYAAMLTGPVMAIPPLKVIEICERVDERWHQLKESMNV